MGGLIGPVVPRRYIAPFGLMFPDTSLAGVHNLSRGALVVPNYLHGVKDWGCACQATCPDE